MHLWACESFCWQLTLTSRTLAFCAASFQMVAVSMTACGCRMLHSQANVTPAQLLLNISKITCVYVKYRTNTGLTSATMSHLYHSRLHGLDEVCIVFMYVRRLSVYTYLGPRTLSRR